LAAVLTALAAASSQLLSDSARTSITLSMAIRVSLLADAPDARVVPAQAL
jgi:hypothetical protein